MDVGRHSTPVNGEVVANGHAPVSTLAPFTIPALQVRPSGPMSPWPQPPGRTERLRHAMSSRRAWLDAIPVILVNVVAFGAQLGFWRVHVPLLTEAVLVALALESIAIYLAWHAHLAQLADDSSLRLRLAAYGVALLIGALNYSHFDGPGWRPTVPAVTFGMMSAISPWLWSVHSRRASRDALKAKGLIEPHAVRLGGTRWLWHLIRSWRVMFRATWVGEADPAVAVALPRLPRTTSADTPADVTPDVTPDVPEVRQEDISGEEEARTPAPSPGVVKPVRAQARKRAPASSARARVVALLKDKPGLDDAEVMKRLKVSKSTVERARSELAKETI